MAPDATHALAVREKVQKFLQAACSGDVELFKKLAKQLDDGKGLAGTVADVKDANKRGALIFAAREGKTELCKYLVEELKVDVNEKDEEGMDHDMLLRIKNSLHSLLVALQCRNKPLSAVCRCDIMMIEGAEKGQGETPVLHAARHGHTATVQYLIEQGADPATPSASGATALHHAAGNGHIEVVKLLLSKGVNVDFQSDAGTPLMWAAGLGHEDVVEVLLEHHANLHAQTDDDNCPLISAVAANSLPCVELLVKAGANVNVKAGDATPLLIAAHNGSTEIINCLLQAGADPTAADEDGNKPIQLAATSGSRAAVEALLAVTPRIQSVPEWSVDGVIEFMQSEYRREQEREEAGRKANKSREASIPKKDLPEVTPEAKKKAAEAKARGDEAFKRNDIATAIDAYTQAIDFDPTDGTLFSNRSLCWIRMGQAEHALSDAKACKELRPDWAKACYREGAALQAATAFYEGVHLDPESKELVTAFREAVEAGRKFHGTDKNSLSSSKS
ncbi:putative ankyrin repeat domain-containing protein 17-like isoform X2 [Capsicum annuum]|nr:putative ankyrin repeat domain-containing protein 17-like isoform X2 [Capsicum annuum]